MLCFHTIQGGKAASMRSLTIGLLCLLAVAPAPAEIEMVAVPTERDLAYHWWPKITIPDGWHHERNASVYFSLNALAPDGFTFDDARPSCTPRRSPRRASST